VSALFAAAIESTTLYTRLRTTDRVNASSLGHMTDLLNVFGKQTIASLEMSPVEPPKPARNGDITMMNARGENISSLYNNNNNNNNNGGDHDVQSESGSQRGIISLDVDLSSPQDLRLDAGMRRPRKRHVFSQIQTYRGPENEEGEEEYDSAIRGRSKIHK
jgi:hypothetical protein